MVNKLTLLFVLVLNQTLVYPQKNAIVAEDSIKSDFDIGIDLVYKGLYDSSNYHLKKAAQEALSQNDSLRYIYCLNNIGYNYTELNRFDSAKHQLLEAYKLGSVYKNGHHEQLAISYNSLGVLHEFIGNYDSALHFKFKNLHKNIDLFGEQSANVATSHGNISLTYLLSSNFSKSLEHQIKSKHLRESIDKNHEDLIYNYFNLGVIHSKSGIYDSALFYKLKALDEDLKYFDENHIYIADDYANLAVTYELLGDLQRSYEYTLRSLDIRLKLYDSLHLKVANSLNNLAVLSFKNDKIQQAIKFKEKALDIFEQLLGNHSLTTDAYVTLGSYYSQINKNSVALNLTKKSLDIAHEIFEDKSYYLAEIYLKAATIYKELDLLDSSSLLVNKSLTINLDYFGERHPYIVQCLSLLSEVLLSKGDVDNALKIAHQAIVANHLTFSDTSVFALPATLEIIAPIDFTNDLFFKASLLQTKFNDTKQIHYLISAVDHLDLAELSNRNNRTFVSQEEDKLRISQLAKKIYKLGIQLCYQLYLITDGTRFIEKAYDYCQQSKSGVLLEAFAHSKAKKIAGIPMSVQSEERMLKGSITMLEHNLELLLSNPKSSLDNISDKRHKLLLAERIYEKFIDSVEQIYPKYFQLKRPETKVAIATLQQNYLEKGEAIVDYFMADSMVYISYISNSSFSMIASPSSELERLVRGIRNAIIFEINDQMVPLGRKLYDMLWLDLEKNLSKERISKVIIIPDGILGYLPFEILNSGGGDDFRKTRFLIKDFVMNYAMSSPFMYEQHITPNNFGERDYIAFAPVFSDISKTNFLVSSSQRSIHPKVLRSFTRGDKIVPIPGTEEEVKEISSLYDKRNLFAKYFLFSDAKEELIKGDELGHYKYIHFATHGFVNDQNPDLSGLILTQDSLSEDDGILYVGEIYNLHWNADMVTLSACETGLGTVVSGEGIIGLTRAFIYAGSDNVLVSLWKVSDTSTSQMMIDFYNYLLSGHEKSAALRKAKLNLLKNSKYSNPYYWAPFVLIGN